MEQDGAGRDEAHEGHRVESLKRSAGRPKRLEGEEGTKDGSRGGGKRDARPRRESMYRAEASQQSQSRCVALALGLQFAQARYGAYRANEEAVARWGASASSRGAHLRPCTSI